METIQEKIKEIQLAMGENRGHPAIKTLVEDLFAAMWEQSPDGLSDEMLDAADQLYMGWSANHLARVLNLRPNDLRLALRRERACKCPLCDLEFSQELEPRKYHEYVEGRLIHECAACRRAERQRAQAADAKREREWAQEREKSKKHRQEIYQQTKAIQDAITLAIETDDWIWGIEAYRKHIGEFGVQWVAKPRRIYVPPFMEEIQYPGCMVCGAGPVTLCMVALPMPQSAFSWYRLGGRGVEGALAAADVRYAHEALWWTEASAYCRSVGHVPLLQRPLLCLCARCKDVWAESHPIVYPAWFHDPARSELGKKEYGWHSPHP